MKKGTFFSYARLNSRLSRYFLLCILLMIFNTDSCVSNNFSSNSIAFQANIKKFYVFFCSQYSFFFGLVAVLFSRVDERSSDLYIGSNAFFFFSWTVLHFVQAQINFSWFDA